MKQNEKTVIAAKSTNAAKLATLINRPLGNGLNAREVGEKFDVTLTGEIQISSFTQADKTVRKSAHYLTKEGVRLAVQANFDPAIHKAGATFKAVVLEIPINVGTPDERTVKYAALAL